MRFHIGRYAKSSSFSLTTLCYFFHLYYSKKSNRIVNITKIRKLFYKLMQFKVTPAVTFINCKWQEKVKIHWKMYWQIQHFRGNFYEKVSIVYLSYVLFFILNTSFVTESQIILRKLNITFIESGLLQIVEIQ